MTFRIGQKVACIKRDGWVGKGRGGETFPEFGRIYTIRSIESVDGWAWVRLAEIVNPLHHYTRSGRPSEAQFRIDRFRPIVERKTDISVFTEILRKASKPARAPAFSSNK